MLRSFGYHLVYSDAVGVNAFFVHESVVGKEQLFSIAEAKQYFTQGGEYPALHGHCMRRPWVLIDAATNFADPSLDVNSLPIMFLSHTAGGERFRQRRFYEVKLSGSLQEQLRGGLNGSNGLKKRLELGQGKGPSKPQESGSSSSSSSSGVVHSGFGCGSSGALLQGWSVGVLVVVAFACGSLLQRYGGRLLYASSRGSKYISV
jgi:hypothetical protein